MYLITNRTPGGYKPRFSLNTINGNLKIGNLSIESIEAIHGNGEVTGYRFEKFAYVTDVSEIPEKSLEKLKGLDVLVLGRSVMFLTQNTSLSIRHYTSLNN